MDGLSRHLSRALALRMRLRRAEGVQAALAGQLARFDCAVAVLDRTGRVLMANEAFDALAPTGLMVRDGFVRMAHALAQERFDRLVAATCGETRGADAPDTLALPRPDGLLPLLLRAMPIRAATAERVLGDIPVDGVLLTALDASHAAYPDATQALRLLGLTKAQARVALLVANGTAPKIAAESLRLREVTVRTTVKHLYARLGIASRAELARLVARVAPFTN